VRQLKPSDRWLAYRYLASLAGMLYPFIAAGGAAVAAIVEFESWGVVLAVLIALSEFLVVGFALVTIRVDYELRHYLVGDRSLRVAQGAWKREEVTLSYANIQNLEVAQGPLERIFGFKSLTISTAGADSTPGAGHSNSHVVTLVGLTDAEGLRELMMSMLREHRDAGLGDLVHAPAPAALEVKRLEEVRDAARALLDAARAARGA
jgi:membrane protein YdbS with pleckstrin-like domain